MAKIHITWIFAKRNLCQKCALFTLTYAPKLACEIKNQNNFHHLSCTHHTPLCVYCHCRKDSCYIVATIDATAAPRCDALYLWPIVCRFAWRFMIATMPMLLTNRLLFDYCCYCQLLIVLRSAVMLRRCDRCAHTHLELNSMYSVVWACLSFSPALCLSVSLSL